jgi:hypothetical protein
MTLPSGRRTRRLHPVSRVDDTTCLKRLRRHLHHGDGRHHDPRPERNRRKLALGNQPIQRLRRYPKRSGHHCHTHEPLPIFIARIANTFDRNHQTSPNPNRRILPFADHSVQGHRRNAGLTSDRCHTHEPRNGPQSEFVHRCCRHSQSPPRDDYINSMHTDLTECQTAPTTRSGKRRLWRGR